MYQKIHWKMDFTVYFDIYELFLLCLLSPDHQTPALALLQRWRKYSCPKSTNTT